MTLSVYTCDEFKCFVKLLVKHGEGLKSNSGTFCMTIDPSELYSKYKFGGVMRKIRSIVEDKVVYVTDVGKRGSGSIELVNMGSYHSNSFYERKDFYEWQVVLVSRFYKVYMGIRQDGTLFIEVYQKESHRDITTGNTVWGVCWNYDFEVEKIGNNNEKFFLTYVHERR